MHPVKPTAVSCVHCGDLAKYWLIEIELWVVFIEVVLKYWLIEIGYCIYLY